MSKNQQKTVEELFLEALVDEGEQPYKLPDNWIWVKFGTVASLVNGYAFKSKDYIEEGIPIVRISDIVGKIYDLSKAVKVPNELYNERFIINKGDLLIAMSGATTGKTGIFYANENAMQNQRVGNIKEIDRRLIERAYKNLFIQKSKDEILSLAYGGAQPNISGKLIEEMNFPLPPINEQKRISDKLDYLLNKIEEAKQLIDETKETFELRRAAVLDKAIRGELTEKWRSRNTGKRVHIEPLLDERKRLKETNISNKRYTPPVPIDLGDKTKGVRDLFQIPSSWQWVSIDQVTWSVSDGPHFSPNYVEEDKGVPFISTRNIKYRGIDFTDCKFVSEEDHLEFCKRTNAKLGDVIITKGGTTGIATVVEETEPFSIWVHLALLKIVKSYISPYYLRDVLTSRFVYNQSQAQTRGVTNKDLGLTRLIYMAIPLPPLEEQQEIVKVIDTLFKKFDAVEEICKQSILEMDVLKNSILQKAFRGELGTNDPTEENAIELLKEVLQEKAK
ncbi:MAG: Type restriction-modification system, specificity subunit [Bacillales bacterium]|jgi:type I restriction enzyme S subunit|nr:Type restriction-modification system, specificity subunit [Bacillales bacterium]